MAPFAVLGTHEVCLWTAAGNPNLVCDKASEQYPCPVRPRIGTDGALTCSGIAMPLGVSTPMLIRSFPYRGSQFDVTLGLIPSGNGYETADPCVDIRRIRNNFGVRRAWCQRILPDSAAPEYFVGHDDYDDAALVSTLSARYVWSESKNMRVDLVQNDRIRWSTGGNVTEAAAWPCVDHPFATQSECTIVPNSLFCQKVNCGANPSPTELRQLANLNQRIVEATTLLKGLGHMDFHKIFVPATLSAVDLEKYAPMQHVNNADYGAYLRIQAAAPDPRTRWEDTVRFSAYTPDGGPGTLPLFFKHYPKGSSTATDYFVASGAYRTIMPLVGFPSASPELRYLTSSATLCGGRANENFERNMQWRTHALDFQPDTYLPKGDGLAAPAESLDAGTVPDLPYLTTRFHYDDQGVADAAELLCEARRGVAYNVQAGSACPGLDPTTLLVADDFQHVVKFTECKAAAFERSMGSLVLPRIPFRVLQGLHDSSLGGFPTVGGEMGAQMHRLRAALLRFGELNTAVRDSVQEVREVVEDMRVSLAQVGVRNDQEAIDVETASLRGTQARIRLSQIDFQEQAAWAQATVDCAGGIASGIANAMTSFGGSLVGGAAGCASALTAASLESQNLKYERQVAEVEQAIAEKEQQREELDLEYVALEHARDMVRQRGLIRAVAGRMGNLQVEMRASLEEIIASLAEMERLRLSALRAISRATQYESTAAAVTRNVDSVLNAKLDVSRRRYLRAHRNAIRLAFLAKRAIEQRLGTHLSELRADLPLVDAPASWEANVCAAQGVDYATLRDVEAGAEKDFQDAYIGDYVGNLRNVVESYRLEFDFHEGTDEVVASVRDDVFGVRQFCAKSLGNRLTYSGTLDRLTNDPAQPGWIIEGCPAGTNGVASTCLDLQPAGVSPLADANTAGDAPGYQVTWGAGASLQEKLVQRLSLSPGRYRLSWFTKLQPPTMSFPVDWPEIDAQVYSAEGGSIISSVYADGAFPFAAWVLPALNGYSRLYRIIDVKTEGDYLVKLSAAMHAPVRIGAVGGIMLEGLSALDAVEEPKRLRPPPFVATHEDTARMIKACEDSDGSAFRGQVWTRRCEQLCGDGFSGSCEQSDGASSCYWETTIGIDQRDLESGVIFKHAGFAVGNFNYRIEDVAVNFVGAEVRDCEASENPSTCYAGGFVPYSLKHLGPYFVRNHAGADFNAKLFTGNIEHARGLALERYLTNPLSSTDRELLAPYVRGEFQGRPLDGSLLLRVWEQPGVDFNAIEDVQLYIKYRYWTRSQ